MEGAVDVVEIILMLLIIPRMYSNSYLANPKDGELLFNKAVEATIMDLIEFLKL